MKSARYGLILPTVGMLLMFGSSMARNEQPLALSQVPKPALNAAQKVLGTTPTEARMIAGTNPQQYELSATDRSGRAASVQVLQDGQMVKKEKAR